jgi:hypothetical protein
MPDSDMDLDRLLGGLPRSQSDHDRAERVRIQCRRVLLRAQPRTPAVTTAAPRRRRLLESALVGAFGVVYLCAVVLFALKTQGVL